MKAYSEDVRGHFACKSHTTTVNARNMQFTSTSLSGTDITLPNRKCTSNGEGSVEFGISQQAGTLIEMSG